MTKSPLKETKTHCTTIKSHNDLLLAGVEAFKGLHCKFFDFSFSLILKYDQKVIPFLKDAYLTCIKESDISTYLTPFTSEKEIKKVDLDLFYQLPHFIKTLDMAMAKSNDEIFISSLDKKYFIEDIINQSMDFSYAFNDLLSSIAKDILHRQLLIAFNPMLGIKNQTVTYVLGNNDLTDFELLCLFAYDTKKLDLYPPLKAAIYAPAKLITEQASNEEINLIEYSNSYTTDIQTIVWEYTLKYLSEFKSNKIDKVKSI